jgi:hypothetical protein
VRHEQQLLLVSKRKQRRNKLALLACAPRNPLGVKRKSFGVRPKYDNNFSKLLNSSIRRRMLLLRDHASSF